MQAHVMALMQQESLENLNQYMGKINFHIYMIVRRPRIAFKPDSIKFSPTIVDGTFTIQKGALLEEYAFSAPNAFGSDSIRVNCPWPHTQYEFVDINDKVLSKGKVALLLPKINPEYWRHLNLEIMYVGQSYGVAGERAAKDRLVSHSTLQKIYSEAQQRAPDQEIWIVMFELKDMFIMSIDGTDGSVETTDAEDDSHIHEVLSTPISESQKINFTEAALIKYFQPEYNMVFLKSFPNPAHKTYSECYGLDINSVAFEIDSEDLINCRLWSKVVPPKWVHFGMFPLHDVNERRGLFEIDGILPK
ncbi:MAG: hypothetical protein A2020_14765 [Lentisphaerae bacterium GWF2_45_14]|nr:MAG: hypothetical protein A2020_14765 [Lentisphaerae bacterium GWF2_45_14]